MIYSFWILIVLNLALTVVLFTRWQQLSGRVRKLFVLVIMIGMPGAIAMPVTQWNFSRMQKKNFCAQCHEMSVHVKSVDADDDEPLSAVHYQNNYVPQETACFACHTDYGPFGPFRAKLNGLRHMLVHFTHVPTPAEKIKLYKPYDVGICLHCHAPSKRFRAKDKHNTVEAPLSAILSGEKGCMIKGCHDLGHLLED